MESRSADGGISRRDEVVGCKRELVKTAHETADTKIFLLLKDKLTVGTAIPKKEIRQILQGIYDYLKLNKKAKATDLNA